MMGGSPLPAGGRITDKVQLIELLATGGMSWVWLARHRDLDAEVVVKLIDLGSSIATRERFEREARLASRLRSPHVVRVLDVGTTEDGVPFIVMERLVGETLASALERGPLGLEETVRIIAQIADALSEAHAAGAVHRDIKPANVFLMKSPLGAFVKVLDFGIAKVLDPQDASQPTQTGALMGTPSYMSPEQLVDASDVEHRSDLWSLAVVAYEMICGCRPFEGAGIAALSMAICNGYFVPPSVRRRDLPASIDAWFVRALSPSREERFASASELSESFREAARVEAHEMDLVVDDGDSSADKTSALVTTVDASPTRARSTRRLLSAAVLAGAASVVTILSLWSSPRETAVLHTTLATVPAGELLEVEPVAVAPPAEVASEEPREADEPASEAARAALPTPVPATRPAAPRPAAIDCSGDEAFFRDDRGLLKPRPECL